MISIAAFIILIGILIFIHELGHFLMARMMNVGVLKFSLGFGPKIIGKKIGETEYVISWIPLGGFVKLLGESDGEKLPPEDEKRSFLKQPHWKRIVIVFAGPFFNFLLAIFIFIIVFMYGVPNLTTEVGEVQKGSAAFASGMAQGDKIISIDGKEVTYWEEIRPIITESKGREVAVVVERKNERKTFPIKPKLSKSKDIFGDEISSYLLGITPAGKIIMQRRNPGKALIAAFQKTWEISKLTVLAVIKMLEGTISPRTLGGPIFIAQIAGSQVKEGVIPFILFMALLSINLGVINLFPIPVLDGGQIMFSAIEMIIRKEISVKAKEISQQIGFALLVMLMVFVIIIDIERMNFKVVNDVLNLFK